MSATPREFILHWHREARLAPPRLVPNGWERTAMVLMEQGITTEDLSLVAGWMLTQLSRSQGGERNSVAFNARSFAWGKMFGEYGGFESGNEFGRFAEMLTLAEAAKKRSGRNAECGVKRPATPVPISPEDAAAGREQREQAMRDFERTMQGGPR